MLRQSLDPVKIPLDRMRIKRRQKLLRNKILMLYDMQLRVIHIQPFRYMSPGNKMDLPHPRCILLNAPEPVLQVVPVPVTLLPAIYMNTQSLSNQRLILFFLPFWVISIYLGNYKIYWFFFSPVHFFSHLQLKKCLRHSPVIYYIFLLPAFRFFFSGITLFFIYIPSYLLISIT